MLLRRSTFISLMIVGIAIMITSTVQRHEHRTNAIVDLSRDLQAPSYRNIPANNQP